jgi:hypothetical protein
MPMTSSQKEKLAYGAGVVLVIGLMAYWYWNSQKCTSVTTCATGKVCSNGRCRAPPGVACTGTGQGSCAKGSGCVAGYCMTPAP